MLHIEIDMRDLYRSLGAGRHVVRYLGFEKGRLDCEDMLGRRVRVPGKLFRFKRVCGRETRVAKNGEVEIKVDGRWESVGLLFPGLKE